LEKEKEKIETGEKRRRRGCRETVNRDSFVLCIEFENVRGE